MKKAGDSGEGRPVSDAADGGAGDAGQRQPAAVADFDEHLNRSLDDVIELLEREIGRLKASLETYRLSTHPQRAEIVRWHVRTLDERQDALESLQALILAERQGKALH